MQASHVRVKMVTCLGHPSYLQVLETLENFVGYLQGTCYDCIIWSLISILDVGGLAEVLQHFSKTSSVFMLSERVP